MGVFTKWYISMLKSRPLVTNMGSALILMTAGDAMAQGIEKRNADDTSPHRPKQEKISFRRYGTLSLRKQEELCCELPDQNRVLNRGVVLASSTNIQEGKALLHMLVEAQSELSSLDLFRTSTMAVWAVVAYTPFYVLLYRLFDRYLPTKTTALTVSTRVGLSFLASIPVNAAFFTYGCFVHHFTEWVSLLQEWRYDLEKNKSDSAPVVVSWADLMREVPFDFSMAATTTRLKLEAELWRTVTTSGSVWIPINMINFTLVPAHLRPLTLMVCSAFWNCYLSLAQHRDAGM